MLINIYTNANNLKKFYLRKLVQQKCGNFEVDDSNGFTKIIWLIAMMLGFERIDIL